MEESYVALPIMIKACVDLIACMENFEGARVRRQLEFLNKAMEPQYLSPAVDFGWEMKWVCGY